MDERNLFCDQLGCSSPATHFGLSHNATKTKVCEGHLSVFSPGPVFDIAAHFFVHSAEDGVLYERRRDLMMKGFGNISVLEEKGNSDLEATLTDLNSSQAAMIALVEHCYKEMQHKVRKRHAEAKEVLETRRQSLAKLVVDKQFKLTPVEIVLCGDLFPGSLFRMVFGDCRVQVAKLLLEHCYLLPQEGCACIGTSMKSLASELEKFAREQMEEKEEDVAWQTCVYARNLGLGDSIGALKSKAEKQRSIVLKQLFRLLPNGIAEPEIREVARKYAEISEAAREVGDYEKADKKLQKAKLLIQQWESPELCLQQGLIFAHFGQWIEADGAFRQGLSIESSALNDETEYWPCRDLLPECEVGRNSGDV